MKLQPLKPMYGPWLVARRHRFAARLQRYWELLELEEQARAANAIPASSETTSQRKKRRKSF